PDGRPEAGRGAGRAATGAVAATDEEAGVGRVPVPGQVAARFGVGGEVIVGVAVEQVLQRRRAHLHHRVATAVGVAHGVALVPAVAVGRGVRRAAVHRPEGVHQLVGLDRVVAGTVTEAPAGGVDPGVLGVETV